MFCPNCGIEVRPGQRFCMNCGHKLVDEGEATVPAPVPAEDVVAEAAEPVEVEAAEPVEIEPAVPVEAESVEPAECEPVKAVEAEPVEPAEFEPVETVEAEPVESEPAVPAEAEAAEPEAPEPAEAPVVAEEAEPATPESVAAAEEALFEAVEAVKPVLADHPQETSGVVVERIDLSSISAAPAATRSAEGEATAIPQPEPVPVDHDVAAETSVIPQPVDATMVRPVPQPVPGAVPVPVSSPADAQGGYAAPPAAAYTPQAVPQPAARKAWYSSPVVAVLAGLVAFGAAASIAFRAVGGLFVPSSSDDPKPIEEVAKDDEDGMGSEGQDFAQIIDQLDDATDSDATPTYVGAEGDYLESHGYPTLLAFMELSGRDLASLVTSHDYFFYEEGGSQLYAKRDGSIVFNVLTDGGYLDEDDYDGLSVGGQAESAVYIAVLEGYDSPEAVLDGIAGCDVSERKAVSDKEVVAVVHGPSMREYLVDIYDVEEGDYEIDLYSPEAIYFGFFDTVNEGTYGSTAREVLSNYGG